MGNQLQLVLCDTSVLVEYFRNRSPISNKVAILIAQDRLALSPFVKLELLLGVRKHERIKLESTLSATHLVEVNMKLFKAAETLCPVIRRAGVNAGATDFLIALQALSYNFLLFSKDKVMLKVASLCDIELYNE